MRGNSYLMVTSQTYRGDVPTSLNSEVVPRNRWVSDSTSFIYISYWQIPRYEPESSGMRSGNVTNRATALILCQLKVRVLTAIMDLEPDY